MRYIIHAGPWKTGTTSLQKCWSDSRELLRAAGVYYPEYILTLDAHHQIPHSILGTLDVLNSIFNQDLNSFNLNDYLYKVRIEAENLQCSFILFSSESFANFNYQSYLKLFEKILLKPDDTVDIFWINREVTSSIESFIWQGINTGDYWKEVEREILITELLEINNRPNALIEEFANNLKVTMRVLPYVDGEGKGYTHLLHNFFLPIDIAEQLVEKASNQNLNQSGSNDMKNKLNEFNSFNLERVWQFGEAKMSTTNRYPRQRQRFVMYRALLLENENLSRKVHELSEQILITENSRGHKLLTSLRHVVFSLKRTITGFTSSK
jgi:hypothetical protein